MTEKDYRKKLKDKLIEYRTTLNLPKNITFGIEIEYENILKDLVTSELEFEKNFSPDLVGWINKSESDIREYNKLKEEMNGEVVSPVLIDNPSAWENLQLVLDILDRKYAIITKKCGGHVNIGTQVLGQNKEYWRNFLLLWILYEKVIYKFYSGEYNNIRFVTDSCIGSISQNIDLNKIINIKRESYLKTITDSLFDKVHDIYIFEDIENENRLNNRIEFRIPNGSISPEIWQNYINFSAKFLLACKKELDIEKILFKIKNKEVSAVELSDYIFDNDIDKEFFLIQTLKTNKIYKKELLEHKYYY